MARFAVTEETDRLLDLVRKEWNLDRALASMRADIGVQLLRIRLALKDEGVRWTDWLARERDLALQRGLPPLVDTTARAYIRMARFRHEYPDLAPTYLQLDPWAVCAVLTLPHETLRDFARHGVPTQDGTRVPLPEATVRQLRWAAKDVRARATGVELPPDPGPKPRAPVSADPVEQAVALIRQAGRLDLGQIETVIGAVLDVAGVKAPPATRREIAVTIAGAAAAPHDGQTGAPAPDRRTPAALPQVAETLESVVGVSDDAEGPADAETLGRLRRALARICAGIGTVRRRAHGAAGTS
jgi:hypothetical protein